MNILSENTSLNSAGPMMARRAATIAAGLLLGLGITVHGIHAGRQPATVVSATAPAPATPVDAKAKRMQPSLWHETGLASWYGPEFQGKETANGEIFNMNDLTCAHRSLPLGTWVKVTNLHTHRWIVARVNDRGPVPDTRITDLSSAAAHMLGMSSRGVTRVRLDVIDPRQAVEIARLERIRLARQAAAQAEADNALPGGE